MDLVSPQAVLLVCFAAAVAGGLLRAGEGGERVSDGRTIWRARDTHWREREWIVILGEEFGAAGPAVIDYLEDQAKLQNDGGRVKTGPRAIARGSFVDVVTVGHVLSRSVTLGLLDEFEDRDGRFTCRVTWFAADQGKAMAANRKAKQRASTPVEPDDPSPLSRSVPESHGESRPVTECPTTGQDRTDTSATQRNTNAELRSAVRECFAYWQERCGHPQAQLTTDRRGKVETRLRDRQRHHGGDLHAAILDVRRAIDGAALGAFVNDQGKRFDDIELICRNGSKLEDFMDRASLRPPAAVVPINGRRENASDLLRALDGGAA